MSEDDEDGRGTEMTEITPATMKYLEKISKHSVIKSKIPPASAKKLLQEGLIRETLGIGLIVSNIGQKITYLQITNKGMEILNGTVNT